MAKQLKDDVWIRLPKQVTFQFLTKCCDNMYRTFYNISFVIMPVSYQLGPPLGPGSAQRVVETWPGLGNDPSVFSCFHLMRFTAVVQRAGCTVVAAAQSTGCCRWRMSDEWIHQSASLSAWIEAGRWRISTCLPVLSPRRRLLLLPVTSFRPRFHRRRRQIAADRWPIRARGPTAAFIWRPTGHPDKCLKFKNMCKTAVSSHHMETTETGLICLCIREITLSCVLKT